MDTFIPSNMNFQTFLMSYLNVAKLLYEKSWSVRTMHSNLKYALTLKYHRIEKFLPKAVPCR